MEGEVITLQKLFEFKIDRIDAERRIVGRLHPTGPPTGVPGEVRAARDRVAAALFGEPLARSSVRTRGAARELASGEATRAQRPSSTARRARGGARSSRARRPRAADASSRAGRARSRALRSLSAAMSSASPEAAELDARRRRGAGERRPGHGRRVDSARGERAPLRRRARARCERQHDRRPVRRGARGRPHVRHATGRRRGESASSPSTARCSVLQAPTDDGEGAAATRCETPAGARLRNADLRRARRFARAAARARSSRPDRSCCSPTAPTSAACTRSTGGRPAAKKQQVRIFTVGLRSGAFDPGAAPVASPSETGGSYAEARSAAELAAIYEALGTQLAGEYLVRYRSDARPMSQVDVSIEVAGARIGGHELRRADAVAAARRTIARSSRGSSSRTARRSCSRSSSRLLVCGAVAAARRAAEDDGRRPRRALLDRGARALRDGDARRDRAAARRPAIATPQAGGRELERDLELARMTVTPRQVVATALAGTVAILVFALAALGADARRCSGLTTPLVARGR